MKRLVLAFSLIFLFSCEKGTIQNNQSYQLFIGKWENDASNNGEKISVEFLNNGKIIIKKGIERTVAFFPQTSSHDLSDHSTTNGVFWDHYEFKGGRNEFGFLMNPTRDTITSPYRSVDNFVYENNLSSNYLTKQ